MTMEIGLVINYTLWSESIRRDWKSLEEIIVEIEFLNLITLFGIDVFIELSH